tara:strand:- start:457 stop:705 length:249 start_codon:yes stop_codon:yes gene_type:complete
MDRFFNPTSRHLDLLPVIHHAIWQRYSLETEEEGKVVYPKINEDKLTQLAESYKGMLVENPADEHLYMEKVIVEYGLILNTA